MLDYIRIACAVNPVQVGNVNKNVLDICEQIACADKENCDLVVFPELALTGYTCGDLFFQQSLLTAVEAGMRQLLICSAAHPGVTVVVGLPARMDGQLYNCAAVVSGGRLSGLVPKTFLPNYGQFAEKRWFVGGAELRQKQYRLFGLDYPVDVGNNILFYLGEDVKLGIELCEDLWAPIAPSTVLAMAGAEIIVNPAAVTAAAGKRNVCRELVKGQSSSAVCAYALCSAGAMESAADSVYSGQCLIAQNGRVLAESPISVASEGMLIADIDFGFLRQERIRKNTFRDGAALYLKNTDVRCVSCAAGPARSDGSRMRLNRFPFVPECVPARLERCREIFDIQVAGLKRRLSAINAKAVIGVSGGLDSTLALLVAVEAMRQLGRPLTDVYGITMPCFGTTERTCNNAEELMGALGISSKRISIRDAVMHHFSDIGQDPDCYDATYENCQARERTQVLMDFAGKVGGIVVGTGDLSELALGWCTYNGDHMSMYSVNSSVPKTLIPHIIAAIAQLPEFAAVEAVLSDILATPISPELLPPDAQGNISQQTEDIVGPYALHDFFLFYTLRCGFSPTKIYALACRAFSDDYETAVIKKWLTSFYRRFFSQQFKRNCQPDGVKVGSVGLGPRGDWRMPSDASAQLWLAELDTL